MSIIPELTPQFSPVQSGRRVDSDQPGVSFRRGANRSRPSNQDRNRQLGDKGHVAPRRSEVWQVALLVTGMTVGPWSIWLSAIAQAHGVLSWRLPQGLAIWSILPGLVLALLVVGGRAAVRDVWSRLVRWRVPVRVAVASAVCPALVAGLTILVAAVGHVPLRLGGQLGGVSALVYFTYGVGLWLLTEEAGWRGAILPRLQRRLSPLVASLVLGGIWAAWHVPLLHAPGAADNGVPLLPFVVLVIAASVLITAAVNAAGGSVLVAAVFHSSFDAVFAWTGVVGADKRLVVIAALVMSLAAALVVRRTTLPSAGSATYHPVHPSPSAESLMASTSPALASLPVRRLERPTSSGTAAIGYQVAGEGPLAICVPGMGELASAYRFTLPALVEAGFRVAVMDLRGHGHSDATFDRYDDVATGEDVLAVAEALGVTAEAPAVLVGTSMGAGAVTWAAAQRPQLVAGLVLIGAFVRNPPMNPMLVAAFRILMGGPWAGRVWKAYLPQLYPGRRPADFDQHRTEVAASLRRPAHRRAFSATTRTTHAPVEAVLDHVAAPSLVVMGTADPDFADATAEAHWIAERLHGDVVLVEGAGHYPQVQEPERVNPELVTFCRRVTRR